MLLGLKKDKFYGFVGVMKWILTLKANSWYWKAKIDRKHSKETAFAGLLSLRQFIATSHELICLLATSHLVWEISLYTRKLEMAVWCLKISWYFQNYLNKMLCIRFVLFNFQRTKIGRKQENGNFFANINYVALFIHRKRFKISRKTAEKNSETVKQEHIKWAYLFLQPLERLLTVCLEDLKTFRITRVHTTNVPCKHYLSCLGSSNKFISLIQTRSDNSNRVSVSFIVWSLPSRYLYWSLEIQMWFDANQRTVSAEAITHWQIAPNRTNSILDKTHRKWASVIEATQLLRFFQERF